MVMVVYIYRICACCLAMIIAATGMSTSAVAERSVDYNEELGRCEYEDDGTDFFEREISRIFCRPVKQKSIRCEMIFRLPGARNRFDVSGTFAPKIGGGRLSFMNFVNNSAYFIAKMNDQKQKYRFSFRVRDRYNKEVVFFETGMLFCEK